MDFSLRQLMMEINKQNWLKHKRKSFLVFDLLGEILYKFQIQDLGYLIISINDGLLELNKEKIIHRDLKPENILINITGEVKIADFGVSSIEYFVTRDGTDAYQPPEALDKEITITNYLTYDVWSLGIIILEFFRERHPFTMLGRIFFVLAKN
jgi:serine/threonine protein kinase